MTSTKWLNIPLIDGADPLINAPDQLARAFTVVDSVLGDPPRALAIMSSVQPAAPANQWTVVPINTLMRTSQINFASPSFTTKLPGLYLIETRVFAQGSLAGALRVTSSGAELTVIPLSNLLGMGAALISQAIELGAGEVINIQVQPTSAATVSSAMLSLTWLAPLTTPPTPVRAVIDGPTS